MKRILLILFSAITLSACTKNSNQNENFDTTNFPEVSFVWHTANPNPLDSTQFSLKEEGVSVYFTVDTIGTDSVLEKTRSILFLWEDQPKRKEECYFAQKLLLGFVDKIKDDSLPDRFNVAIFNRKQNNSSVFLKQFPKFTVISDTTFQQLMELHEHRTDRILSEPEKSDLLLALKDGLDLIAKEPRENTKAIVVFTAGLYMYEGIIDVQGIINLSLQYNIPVYFVKLSNYNESVITSIADKTYGQIVSPSADSLLACFETMNKRQYGLDYKITFTSQLNRDKKQHELTLYASGKGEKLSFETPAFSLWKWAAVHWIWAIILLLLTLSIITIGSIFGIKLFKNIQQKTAARKEKQKQKEAEYERLKRQLEATQRNLQDHQRKIEQSKQMAHQTEQEEKLTASMQNKNLFPKLILSDGSEFTISRAITTIGRENDNDIVLPYSKVSKHHAKICFNGLGFEIYDTGSSNGVKVNDVEVENVELTNSDLITVGEIMMKFYM